MIRAVFLGITAVVALLAPPGVAAQPTNCSLQATYADGAVFVLENTPHIWLFDNGVLRWVGDTRALAGRAIRWDRTCVVSSTHLQVMTKGDPFLSAGLVKIGDPIYLAKWEATETVPTLLHIQAIEDVRVFGINAQNYTRFVMERDQWERRYGFDADKLPKGALDSALPIFLSGDLRFSNFVTGWQPSTENRVPTGRIVPVVYFQATNIGRQTIGMDKLILLARFQSSSASSAEMIYPTSVGAIASGLGPGQQARMALASSHISFPRGTPSAELPSLTVEIYDSLLPERVIARLPVPEVVLTG